MSAVGRMQLKMMGDQNVMDALKSSDRTGIRFAQDPGRWLDSCRRVRSDAAHAGAELPGAGGKAQLQLHADRASQAKMIGKRCHSQLLLSIANRCGRSSRQEFRNSVGLQRSFGWARTRRSGTPSCPRQRGLSCGSPWTTPGGRG